MIQDDITDLMIKLALSDITYFVDNDNAIIKSKSGQFIFQI